MKLISVENNVVYSKEMAINNRYLVSSITLNVLSARCQEISSRDPALLVLHATKICKCQFLSQQIELHRINTYKCQTN